MEYKLLYQQATRTNDLQDKMIQSQKEQIESYRIIVDEMENQKEVLEAMLLEIRDMAADKGDERITTH